MSENEKTVIPIDNNENIENPEKITTTTTTTTNHSGEIVLSKNQLKKKLKSEKWAKAKAESKLELKQRKKDNKKKRKEMMTPEELNAQIEIKKKKKRDPSQLEYSGRVLFDFEACHLMTDGERKSLLTQVQFLYGTNKVAEKPFHLEVSGFTGAIKEKFQSLVGSENWNIDFKSEPYIDTYKDRKSDLVYLTSDSPNLITTLDSSKVYIIGGLVDHNRLKGLTYNKASEQGIHTAKLPISEFITLQSRKVLAVNHVFDILVKFTECNDWKKAFETVIPTRRFEESKKQSSKNSNNNDDENDGGDDNKDENEQQKEIQETNEEVKVENIKEKEENCK